MVIDIPAQRVTRGDEQITLPNLSFDLLKTLIRHSPNVVTHDQLMDEVWPGIVVSQDTVAKRVNLLRTSLGDESANPRYVSLVRGRGYRLAQPVEKLNREPPAGRVVMRATLGGVLALVLVTGLIQLWDDHPAEKSLAILPFSNLSGDQQAQSLTDGIQIDLLTRLVKIGALRVISRTSMQRYRDSDKSIQDIANELGVATVLEGNVQRSSNKIRISVQLTDAQSNKHLWAEDYDRELSAENLFSIQSEISQEIVRALQLVLTGEQNARLAAVPTVNLDAYTEYVMGKQELARRTGPALGRSQRHFEKAIELDPEYALAYVGLADALALQTVFGSLERDASFAPRQAAIDEALQLDPTSGEAYSSLAALRSQQGQQDQAERYYLRAIELSPNYATAFHWYSAEYLAGSGRYRDALPYLRRAIELDPMAPALTAALTRILWKLEKDAEARAAILQGIKQNPQFPFHYGNMAEILQSKGRLGESLLWTHHAATLTPDFLIYRVQECNLHLQLGDDHSAEKCYENVEASFPDQPLASKIDLSLYRMHFREAVDIGEQLAVIDPSPGTRAILARAYLANGMPGIARSIYQDLLPDLFSDKDIEVIPDDVGYVALAGYMLYADGDRDRGNYLFDKALLRMQSMHRVNGPGYAVWDVFIHAARGDRHIAISALRDAIDAGWRDRWWELRFPHYDNLREEPVWNQLMNEIKSDIERQRLWHAAHKDDPLF
ncbi:MAG: winged helix-turn-helix domain-containing protein [Woeseiaceae bacterium]|nr:winged helix-turn-helix domain-containing protein [Woeseiaceae bacterium]